MREAWQANIPRMWKERKVEIPEGSTPEELIKVPENSQYFAALGSVEFGKDENAEVGRYLGIEKLLYYIDYGRAEEKAISGGKGLVAEDAELVAFQSAYKKKKFTPAEFLPGQVVSGFVGIDGGSTSTKAVLLDKGGEILCKAYQLSNGNPIQDTIEMFEKLREQIESKGAAMEVLGVGTTGYAKDILRDVLNADVALVETVAHTESALKFYKDPHVIVDVGGQDIKLIVLKDGRVKDFKLNTQCSAGNGYFLQSTAGGFGLKVEDFADIAFSAKSMPVFGYGCAVFMQSDIVNFQRQGWRSEEILAGLADVLPKNVFLYVASIPNLAALGSRFVLQGGTQNKMAVVKAEVDFIKSSFRANGKEPEIIVHEHCGESGAIGAAQEALRLWKNGKQTTFIGVDAVANIRYRTTRNEDTRCYFCKNNCLRTFIDVDVSGTQQAAMPMDNHAATSEEIAGAVAQLPSIEEIQANLPPPAEAHGSSCSTGGGCSSHAPSPFKAKVEPLVQIQIAPGSSKVIEMPKPVEFQPRKTKVPLHVGEQRLIIATCEKGTVEDLADMKDIKADIDKMKSANPNFVDIAAHDVFRSREVATVADAVPGTKGLFISKSVKERAALMERRKDFRIGIPRLQPHVVVATGVVVQPLAGLDTISGIDLASFDKMSGGFQYLHGGPFQKDDDILVDEYYAADKHLHVGDTVHLIGHDWHLAGIFESGKLTRIAVRLPVLQQLTANPHHLSEIFLKLDNPDRAQEVVHELQKQLPGYPIYTMKEFTSLLSISSVGLLRNFIGVVIGVSIVVGFIAVSMAMYTAVLERTRDIGILKALGVSPALILNLFLKETFFLAVAGTGIGIALTCLTQWIMTHVAHSSLTQETVYLWWPIAGLIAVGVALLGTVAPAYKAIHQDVTEALSYE